MGGGEGSPCFARLAGGEVKGNKGKGLMERQSFWLDNGFLSSEMK